MGLSYIDEMAFFLAVDATPKYVRRRLDEILVAGHFQTVKLKDMDVYGIPWLKLVIRIITEDAVFREQVLRVIDEEVIAALEQLRSLSTQKASGGICFDEYQDLVRLNVLRDLAGDEAYDVIAKLFKVPKAWISRGLSWTPRRGIYVPLLDKPCHIHAFQKASVVLSGPKSHRSVRF